MENTSKVPSIFVHQSSKAKQLKLNFGVWLIEILLAHQSNKIFLEGKNDWRREGIKIFGLFQRFQRL